MKKISIIIILHLSIFFNSNLLSNEKDKVLKVGLLAPLVGEYKELGISMLYSLQLALEEINDDNVFILPRDAGFNNKEKLNIAIEEIKQQGADIIIGPISANEFDEIKKFSDLVFISPSNIKPEFTNNTISVGISLESQLLSITKFLKKRKKNKTIIMFPKNEYAELIENELKGLDLNNFKVFKYSSNPEVLTGEIEKLTNYSQRKKNLEIRKKMFEDKEDEESIKQMERLEQLYTLGKVNFDSVIIIDFGNSLKSVLSSLAYTDVDERSVLFATVNQWFDETVFKEGSIKNLYFPSINMKQFKKYNETYFKTYDLKPDEISILAYDALGLIYYVWNKNNGINSISDFYIKDKIKGKIGTFYFTDNKLLQDLKIYKIEDSKFKEY